MTKWTDPGYRSGPIAFGWTIMVLGLGFVGKGFFSRSGFAYDPISLTLGLLELALGAGTLIWMHRATKRARADARGSATPTDQSRSPSNRSR